jgi:hypothetical protein
MSLWKGPRHHLALSLLNARRHTTLRDEREPGWVDRALATTASLADAG